MTRYGRGHRQLRLQLEPLVQAGGILCWRCLEEIASGTPWDLGHDDIERDRYRGPEHQRCNRATSGRAPNEPAAIPFAHSGLRRMRDCEICGHEYQPTYGAQRTCGHQCGHELRRRNAPVRPPKVSPRRVCACGVPIGKGRRFCSLCRVERDRAASRNLYRTKVGIPLDAPLSNNGRPRKARKALELQTIL